MAQPTKTDPESARRESAAYWAAVVASAVIKGDRPGADAARAELLRLGVKISCTLAAPKKGVANAG